MNFSVLFVTRSTDVVRLIGNAGDRLLDKSLIERAHDNGVRVTTRAVKVDGQRYADLVREIFVSQKNFDAGILVLDEDLSEIGRTIFPSMLYIPLDRNISNRNLQNEIRKNLSLAVKCILRTNVFTNESSFKILSLPFSNFAAPEIDLLRTSLYSGIMNLGFVSDIENFVKKMRNRQNPKTKTPYRTTYIVDEENRFFSASTERHARADTRCPPHTFVCILRSKFRFGHKLDDYRHYNVTMEDDFIKGVFVDCHQDAKIVKPQTHLNMFPNDFF